MQFFFQLVSNFDAFWVTFTPNINPTSNQTFFRTPLGGIVSIIIYVLWLTYSGELLKQWFNNSMVMSVSNQQESTNNDKYLEIFYNSQLTQNFEIKIVWNESDKLDVFKNDEIILLPIMINVQKLTVKNALYFHNFTSKSLSIYIQEKELFNEHILIFASCIGNEAMLDISQKCASQDKVKRFWTLTGLEILMSHTTQSLDIYTKTIKSKVSYITLPLQALFAQYSEIKMLYTFTEIYSGIMFQENLSLMLKTSYLQIVQFAEKGYLDTYFIGYTNNRIFHNVYGAIYLQGDSSLNHVIAQYPTINEILARIGSTLQTLLLVRYILCYFNRKKMILNFREFCKTIYFPELRQNGFEIKTNKQNQKQLKESRQLKKLIESKLDEKLNYANLIYEISRIQILLTEVVNKQKILESHSCNRAICNLFNDSNSSKIEKQNPVIDNFLFNYSTGKELQTQVKQSLIENNLRSKEFQSQLSQAARVNQEILAEERDIFQSRSLRPQLSM